MSETEVVTTETTEQPKSLSLLASEKFPQAFVGEVTEATAEPQETLTVEEGGEIEAGEAAIEGDELSVEGETEGETLTVEGETEPEANTIQDVQAYLSEEHGLDLNFDEVVLDLKVNGKDLQMSIGDLKANSQKLEAADDILESAKTKAREDRAQLQTEFETKNNQATEALTTAATLVQAAEQLLASDRANVDWEKLRTEDKAEYAILREEFKAREDAINQIKTDAGAAYQNWQAQASQEAEAARQENMLKEHEKLLEKIPSWSDEKVAANEKGQVVTALQEYGFTNDEIKLAADHRLILMARDAMLYRNQSETVETTKKKIAKIPKVVKPGSKKTADQRNSEQIGKLSQQMRAKPTVENAFALLKAKRNK